jgi:hypothetical protein
MRTPPILPDLGRFPRRALLTGAGFTKNWGGHLASEVWALLVSTKCVRTNPSLRTIFEGTIGAFEEALECARAGDADLALEAFQALENEVVQVFLDQEHRINEAVRRGFPNGLDEMLSLFGKGPRDLGNLLGDFNAGYIFTLNQDVLIERARNNPRFEQEPLTPGVAPLTTEGRIGREWSPQTYPKHLTETRRIQSDLSTVQLAGNLNYIKLHGSYEWRAADGRNALVVGGGKEQALGSFPLLALYLELFRRICSVPDLRLMVIGYGFGDSHINEIIATGVRETGLRIFLVDPTDPKQTLSKLPATGCPHAAEIAAGEGIDGWSTKPLTETFRGASGSGRSPEYRRILRDFFELDLP